MIVGLGFDLVAIARVEDMLARKEQRALDRLFTPHEQEYALSRARPAMPAFASSCTAASRCSGGIRPTSAMNPRNSSSSTRPAPTRAACIFSWR